MNKPQFGPNDLIREDGRVERLCEHGVGHPIGHVNPKIQATMDWIWVHGCDLCCSKADFYCKKRDDAADLRAGRISFPSSERYVIVDIDGTIADCTHRLHHIQDGNDDWETFEADACLGDAPCWPIINLVHAFHSMGFKIILITGRNVRRGGRQTEEWLRRYQIPYSYLFMRKDGDTRQDFVIKQRLLDRMPKDQIAYVLEDRASVVSMWRRNGLTCLQVNDGDF